MALRNFWIEAQVDGRETPITGGPRSKDGGFEMAIFIRSNGESEEGLRIRGVVEEDGTLVLLGWTVDGQDFRLARKR